MAGGGYKKGGWGRWAGKGAGEGRHTVKKVGAEGGGGRWQAGGLGRTSK